LRDRRADIPVLISHFIQKYAQRINKNITGIDKQAVAMLTNAPYPGNIREMENEIERMITLADDNTTIGIELLSPRFHSNTSSEITDLDDASLKDQVENLEKKLIIDTLKETSGNILRAAEKLRLSRAGLHKKLNRYGIDSKNM
jgi:two-component system response regulator HupR/HoxA